MLAALDDGRLLLLLNKISIVFKSRNLHLVRINEISVTKVKAGM